MVKKIVFVICVLLTIMQGVFTIKYGIDERWNYAYMCSSSCALYLFSSFMVWDMIQRDKEK